MTRIKICGLRRQEDVEYVNQALPDYAGFVVEVPRKSSERGRRYGKKAGSRTGR